MKLGTRSRMAIGVAVLATGALLGPSTPAGAIYPVCTPDTCDWVELYYSDSTYTVQVGQYEDGPCRHVDWGQHTIYVKHLQRVC